MAEFNEIAPKTDEQDASFRTYINTIYDGNNVPLATLLDAKASVTALNTKANSSDLSTVATSGDYRDLSNKPTGYDLTELIKTVYPIGSIYLSVLDVNPGTLFSGTTWVKLENKFLYGSGTKTLGATGGEETHTLTVAEMPSHTHELGTTPIIASSYTDYFSVAYGRDAVSAPTSSPMFNITPRGGNGAHNNMPPYLVVSMWKRTE